MSRNKTGGALVFKQKSSVRLGVATAIYGSIGFKSSSHRLVAGVPFCEECLDSDCTTSKKFLLAPIFGKKIKLIRHSFLKKDKTFAAILVEARIVVKKSQGNACKRNRMRRLLKEALRFASVGLVQTVPLRGLKKVHNSDSRVNHKVRKGTVCIDEIRNIYGYNEIFYSQLGLLLLANNDVLTMKFSQIVSDIREILLKLQAVKIEA